jgi:general L-amino acid transport system permease protein
VKKFKPLPSQPAPIDTVGIIGWLRANMFSSIGNSIASIIAIAFVITIVPPIIDWGFTSANWAGDSQEDCTKDGACWVFVGAWMQQFIYGAYPESQLWRINISFLLLPTVIIAQYYMPDELRKKVGLLLIFSYPIICAAILDGRLLGLDYVSTDYWGGFALNIFLASSGIVASMPLGILWALGRRSDMSFARSVCVVSIEFFRGVPLLTLLFMGSVMLPLFFPAGTEVNKLVRTFIAIWLFQSAYMAEVIRSGLQAIPQGQYEAADSLGLGYWTKMRLIILPQALKISIPNIVSTFISLFKDTTFVIIIGLFEILTTVQSALTNSNWLGGYWIEGYVFVAGVFWVFCFGMSRISASIEAKLNTSHKS